MFFRILDPAKRAEVLYNVAHITKIEVGYGEPDSKGILWSVALEHGIADPRMVRHYRVHIDGEVLLFTADPDSRVVKLFEDIYQNAVKDETRPTK